MYKELQSPEIDQLMDALAKVHKDQGILIKKNSTGHHSKFASQDYILETIRERCNEYGLLLTRRPLCIDGKDYLETQIYHIPSKQFMRCQSSLFVNAESQDPDGEWGYSMTFQSRYGALAITGFAAEDDPSDSDSKRPTINSDQPKQSGSGFISDKQQSLLRFKLNNDKALADKILMAFNIQKLSEIHWKDFQEVLKFVDEYQGSKT